MSRKINRRSAVIILVTLLVLHLFGLFLHLQYDGGSNAILFVGQLAGAAALVVLFGVLVYRIRFIKQKILVIGLAGYLCCFLLLHIIDSRPETSLSYGGASTAFLVLTYYGNVFYFASMMCIGVALAAVYDIVKTSISRPRRS